MTSWLKTVLLLNTVVYCFFFSFSRSQKMLSAVSCKSSMKNKKERERHNHQNLWQFRSLHALFLCVAGLRGENQTSMKTSTGQHICNQRDVWVLDLSISVSTSPAMYTMSLPILTCSYCMRKVGLWNFHQMEGTMGDGDASANTEGPATPTSAPASAAINEGQGEHSTSATATPTTPPCRMKLRSQDSTRAEQASLKTLMSKQLKRDVYATDTVARRMYIEMMRVFVTGWGNLLSGGFACQKQRLPKSQWRASESANQRQEDSNSRPSTRGQFCSWRRFPTASPSKTTLSPITWWPCKNLYCH